MKRVTFAFVIALSLSACAKKEQTPEKVGEPVQQTATKEQLTHIANSAQFETFFTKKDRLIVADLYADWCGPCKMIAPYFSELSGEFGSNADFLKIDVDKNPELAERFKAQSIPLVLFIKNGQVVENVVGAREKEEYRSLIEKNL